VDVRSSSSGTLSPIRFSAAYTIDTLEYSFRKRQAMDNARLPQGMETAPPGASVLDRIVRSMQRGIGKRGAISAIWLI